MYIPEVFAERRIPKLQHLMREHPFATLVTHRADRVEADHLPVLVEADEGPVGTLRGHVARTNPIWRQVAEGSEVLTIFQGPAHYVSPSAYASKKEHGRVVPTWNYIVVHVRGRIRWVRDAEWLRDLVERLTDVHEAGLPTPWKVSDAPAEFVEGMLAGIVGFEIPIVEAIGKWKLSQNRAASDRAGVRGVLAESVDPRARELAVHMEEGSRKGER
jgi:transcriptional regulator